MNYGHWNYEVPLKHEYKPSPIPANPRKRRFDVISATKLPSIEEARELFKISFKRVMDAERRAIQAGQQQLHNILLVRLTTRYQQQGNKYELLLTKFIAKDHRRRSELAMLWLSELYAQYQGFSICLKISSDDEKTRKQACLDHYNKVLCAMLEHFHQNGLHQEVIFYKVILDSPHITSESLQWLKLACIDPTYGCYGMTAVRELILTRHRHRKDLLQLLFQLGFYAIEHRSQVPTETVVGLQQVREGCIKLIQELYAVSFLQTDLRAEIVEMIERCTDEKPPDWFVPLQEHGSSEWNNSSIKCALAIYMSILPFDPSLLDHLTAAYKRAPDSFKTEVVSNNLVDHTIRSLGKPSAVVFFREKPTEIIGSDEMSP